MSIFFFANKKGLRSSNRILGTLISLYGLYIGFLLVAGWKASHNFTQAHPSFWLLFELNYCFGPLLYFYTKSAVDNQFHFRRRDILHFLPGILMLTIVYLNIYEILCIIYLGLYNEHLVIIHLSVYIGLSILTARSRIKSPLSPVDDIRIAWLRFLFLAYVIILTTRIFVSLANLLKWKELFFLSHTVHNVFIFFFFNIIALIALLKPELFSFIVRYQRSILKDTDKELYQRKLLESMDQDKPYLEPSCTLPSLAKKLSIPVPYLSQIVNETFHMSFPDFINRYRIDESKQHILQIPENDKTILEIAYMVGFYSKSSFNNAFKRHTGLTPKDYRNKNKKAA